MAKQYPHDANSQRNALFSLVQLRNGAKNFVSVTVKAMAALGIDNRRICCQGIRFE